MNISRLTGAHQGYADGDRSIALFDHPMGLALSEDGLLYVADAGNHRVRCLHLDDGRVMTVLGNGLTEGALEGEPSPMTPLHSPHAVCLSPWGELHICETGNHRIWRLVTGGWAEMVAGNGTAGCAGDGNPARSAQLNHPRSIAFDEDGVLYIADFGNNLIRAVGPDGWISSLGRTDALKLQRPTAVCPDNLGGLYVAESGGHRVLRLDPDGNVLAVIDLSRLNDNGRFAEQPQLADPTALLMDAEGDLLIADRANGCILKINADGTLVILVSPEQMPLGEDGSPIRLSPTGLAADHEGRLYVSDDRNHCIWVIQS